MSGFKYEVNYGCGTGPMHVNDQVPKLTHKLRHCDYHGELVDPGGGIQRTATKWACAKCWRLLRQGSPIKKAA